MTQVSVVTLKVSGSEGLLIEAADTEESSRLTPALFPANRSNCDPVPKIIYKKKMDQQRLNCTRGGLVAI